MKILKRLTLALGILMGVVSIGMGAMSNEEWEKARYNCFESENAVAWCQSLADDDLKSVEQCDKSNCALVGAVYYFAGRYKEVIPYFEKAIALGDNRGYSFLGNTYYELQDYYNAKKYYKIGCDKGNGDFQSITCYNLGVMYAGGKGVRQNYAKAHELYKKACDMKYGSACNNLGGLYFEGKGVRQNLSTAKQYYGKACDFGNQTGCDNYRKINQAGY